MPAGTPLKLAIVASPYSQREVAEKAGISETYLSKIVSGVHVPADPLKAEIARILGRTVEDLFPSEDIAEIAA